MIKEKFADSEFTKHLSNMEILVKSSLFEQAEAFMHFSQEASNEKFLLVDLVGADYKLYDPDIATVETLTEAPSAEELFYIGNFRETAINNFSTAHKCNGFCFELKMAEIELGESEEVEE